MKSLIIFIISLFSIYFGGAQSLIERSSGSTTPLDSNLFVGKSFRVPVFRDTTDANTYRTLDSSGKIVYSFTDNSLFLRTSSHKWVNIESDSKYFDGASTNFDGTKYVYTHKGSPVDSALSIFSVVVGDGRISISKTPDSVAHIILDTTGLGGSTDSTIFQTKFRSDTGRSNIYSTAFLKLNKTDTGAMLSPYKTSYPRQAISVTGPSIFYNPSTGLINSTATTLPDVTGHDGDALIVSGGSIQWSSISGTLQTVLDAGNSADQSLTVSHDFGGGVDGNIGLITNDGSGSTSPYLEVVDQSDGSARTVGYSAQGIKFGSGNPFSGSTTLFFPSTIPAGAYFPLTVNGVAADPSGNITISGGGVTDIFGRSGSITAQTGDYTVSQVTGAKSITQASSDSSALVTAINGKQATLVSGTNIKTINSATILGSTNIQVIVPADTVFSHNQIVALPSIYFPLVGGSVTGVGGNGFIGLIPQSSVPSTPVSGVKLYARSTGGLSWIGTNGYTRTLLGTYLTGDHAYQLQNKDYTLADSLDVTLKLSSSNYDWTRAGNLLSIKNVIDTLILGHINNYTNPTAQVRIGGSLYVYNSDDQLLLSDSSKYTSGTVQGGTIDLNKIGSGGDNLNVAGIRWYMEGASSSPTLFGVGRVAITARNASAGNGFGLQVKSAQTMIGTGTQTQPFSSASLTVNTNAKNTGVDAADFRTNDSSYHFLRIFASGNSVFGKNTDNAIGRVQIGGKLTIDTASTGSYTADSLLTVNIGEVKKIKNYFIAGNGGVWIGVGATAYDGAANETVAIGKLDSASSPGSVAIGAGAAAVFSTRYDASANNNGLGVAIGAGAKSLSWRAVAIGAGAIAASTSSTVIGYAAYCAMVHGVSEGRGSDLPLLPAYIYNGIGMTSAPINIGTNTNYDFGIGNWWGNKIAIPPTGIDPGSNLSPSTVTLSYHGKDAYDNIDSTQLNADAGHIGIAAGRGTGTGKGGQIRFYTTPTLGAGNNVKNNLYIVARYWGNGDYLQSIDDSTATDIPSATAAWNSTRQGVLFPRMTTTQMNAISSPASGLTIINSDSAYSLFVYSGATWVNQHSTTGAGTGITTLNTLSGSVQTFATGTSGTDFAISSSGTTHTFNIPDASASNRGLITTGTQTIAGTKTFSGANTFSSNLTVQGQFSTNATSANANLTSGGSNTLSGAQSTTQYEVNGNTIQYRVGVRGSASTVATAAADVFAMVIGDNNYTEATSGTSAMGGGLRINTQTFVNGSGATTDFQNLYVGDAPSSTATNNYSINVGDALFRNKIFISTGSNKAVGTATLVGGTVTVSNTSVTSSSKIFLTDATTGALTNIGTPTVGTITAGTGFVINSSNVLDTSNINWVILN